jgi:hypothetical protein
MEDDEDLAESKLHDAHICTAAFRSEYLHASSSAFTWSECTEDEILTSC